MRNILIPIQLNHPEAEESTIYFGARLALELKMGLILSYFLDANTYDDAITRSIEKENSTFDRAELIRQREEFILNTLVEYQARILKRMKTPPPVSYNIISKKDPDKALIKTKMENVELFMLCRENLKVHSFSWIDRINRRILNNDHTPILVHSPSKEFSNLHKVIYGVHYTAIKKNDLVKLAGLFDADQTEIIVLYITDNLDAGYRDELKGELESIRDRTGYHNMSINTMVTREKMNAYTLLHSFAIDREADLIVFPKSHSQGDGPSLQPEAISRQSSKSDIPLMFY